MPIAIGYRLESNEDAIFLIIFLIVFAFIGIVLHILYKKGKLIKILYTNVEDLFTFKKKKSSH